WPCDIFDAMRLPRRERPTSAISLRAGRRRRAIRSAGCQNRKLWRSVACTASAMLPSAVKLSKMLVIWNDRASPAYVYENPRALPRVMLLTDWRLANFDELLHTGSARGFSYT